MRNEQIKQLIEKDSSFILKVNKPSLEMIDLAFKKDVNLYFKLNKKKNNKILELAIRNNLDLNLIEDHISKDLLMKALEYDINNLLKFEKKFKESGIKTIDILNSNLRIQILDQFKELPLDLTMQDVKSIIDTYRKQHINPSLMIFFYEKYGLLLKDIPEYYYDFFCKHYSISKPNNLTLEQTIEINILIAKEYRSFLSFFEPIMNNENSNEINKKIVQTIVEITENFKLTQFDLMKIQENDKFKNLNTLLIDEFFKYCIKTFIYEGYIYNACIHIKLELLSCDDLNRLIAKLIENKKFLIGYESELNDQNLYFYIKEITSNYNFYYNLTHIEVLLKNKFMDSFMLSDLYNLYSKTNKSPHEYICKLIKKHHNFKGNDLATILVDNLK